MPDFYDPKQQASLVAEHRARNQIPEIKPKCAVLCAGMGFDAIAALATHYDIVLLVDVCHHATEELRYRFPKAKVLPLDLRNKDHLAVIAKHRADVVLFGIPCQPSSMCNPHQKTDDVRLKMTALCLTAAVSLKPTLMMAENVAGFVLQRPKHFQQVLDTMEHEKYSVPPEKEDGQRHRRPREDRVHQGGQTERVAAHAHIQDEAECQVARQLQGAGRRRG